MLSEKSLNSAQIFLSEEQSDMSQRHTAVLQRPEDTSSTSHYLYTTASLMMQPAQLYGDLSYLQGIPCS